MNNLGATSSQNILNGQTERIASVVAARSVRIFSKLLVVATFLLLALGALITANKAALADPTWPLFLGNSWFPKWWTGGLVYVNIHRLMAAAVGILAIVVAILIQLNDPRRFMKKLGWAAVLLFIVQALFGGFIVKSMRMPVISMAHSLLAHSFFCLTIAIAVFSSLTWFRDQSRNIVIRAENRSLYVFLKAVVVIVLLQVIMGGGLRHSHDLGNMFFPFLLAHISGAFVVIVVIIWFNLRVWTAYRDVAPLRRAAIAAGCLVIFQVTFGILAIFANRARIEVGVPQLHDVLASTTHLLGGGTLLGLMFGTLLRTRHILDLTTYSEKPGQAYQSREVIQ
jgi:cytochrome c oxidase assembly protein subunit 15